MQLPGKSNLKSIKLSKAKKHYKSNTFILKMNQYITFFTGAKRKILISQMCVSGKTCLSCKRMRKASNVSC